MSQREKLRQKIKQNPKNVLFQDLEKLLSFYGFELKRKRGSHRSFVGMVEGKKTLLVVPYQKPLKEVYVKKALDVIEKIEEENHE